jgi:hypothetical protein
LFTDDQIKLFQSSYRITPPNFNNPYFSECYHARFRLWMVFNEIFGQLPKSIISPSGIFAAHAAFPASNKFLSAIKRSHHLQEREKDDFINDMMQLNVGEVADITWSDIDPNLSENTLFGQNKRGGGGKPGPGMAWSTLALESFSAICGIKLMIRGHQPVIPSSATIQKVNAFAWKFHHSITIASNGGGFASVNLSLQSAPDSLNFHSPTHDS